MKIFTKEERAALDRYSVEEEGVSVSELINRFAEGVTAEVMKRLRPAQPVTVFAGPGNNGADALAVARMLIDQGVDPLVYLFNVRGNSLTRDCRDQREMLLATRRVRLIEIIDSMEPPQLSRDHLIIDGLFGSGLRNPLSGGFMTLVREINESGADVVSIDLPSGLFPDWNPNSISRNIVHANLTVAAEYPRLSYFIADNASLVGQVKLISVGLSKTYAADVPAKYHLVESADITRALRLRNPFSTKDDYGTALLVAGSYGMMGAAQFAARGALRAGVGRLLIHSARCGFNIFQTAVPEAMFLPDKNDIVVSDIVINREYSAIGVGSGLGTADATVLALDSFLKKYRMPTVLDADALNCIARRPSMLNSLVPGSILTPHAGEFDRLFGQQQSAEARLIKGVEIARKYKITLILKGHYTAVIRQDGKIFFNSSGGPAMATPGSGDVLTGIVTGLLAQHYEPQIASVAGVYIHGLAGDIAARDLGPYSVNASDIADAIAPAIKSLLITRQ